MQNIRRLYQRRWLPMLLGVIATIAVLGLWHQLFLQENRQIEQIVEQKAVLIETVLSRELVDRVRALQRIADRWQVSGGTPQPLWEADATTYLRDLPGFQAIEWVDPSFYVRWVVPLAGNEAAQNLDLSQEFYRRNTLRISRELRQPFLSGMIPLVQGSNGFLVSVPIFVGERLDGFVLGVFENPAFFDNVLLVPDGFQVRVYDYTKLMYRSGADPQTPFQKTVTIKAYEVNWQIDVFPTPEFVATQRSLLPKVVLFGGVVGAWTLAFIVYLGQRSAHYVHQARKTNQQLQAEIAERERIEATLRKSEERLHLALEASSEGWWDWNLITNKVERSPQYLKLLGYEVDEFPETFESWEQAIHPDDFPALMVGLTAHLQNRTGSYACDYRVRTKSGDWQWIADYGKVVDRDGNHQPLRMIGTFKDISERKATEAALRQSEASLRQSEEKFRQLAENIRAVFWMSDPTARQVLYVSPAYEEIWGHSCTALYQNFSLWIDAIHPDDRSRVEQAQITDIAQGSYDEEYRIIRPDGSIRWIHDRGFLVRTLNAEPQRIAGIAEDITHRKQAEIALAKELLRSQTLFNTSIDGVVVMNHQGNVIQASPSFAQMLGYNLEEILTLNVADWDDQWTREQLQAIREKDKIVPLFETKHRRKDGSLYDVEISYSRVALEAETIHFCICRNISERKKAEVELQNSQARFAGILEIASDAIISVNVDQQITLFNKGAEQIFGYQAEEVLGKPLSLLMPDRFAQAHQHHVNHYAQTGHKARQMAQRGTIFGRRKDGTEFPAEASISKLILHGETIFTTFLRDITEQKQAELALQQSEAKYRRIIQTAYEGIWVIDTHNFTSFVNPRMANMLGYDIDEMLGQPLFAFIPEENRGVAQDQLNNRRQGLAEQYEFQFQRKDGKPLWVLVSANPITDEAGEYAGAIAMMTDISDRKIADMALVESRLRYQNLVENSPDIIERFDLQLRHLYVSSSLTKITGIASETFMGKTCRDLNMDEAMVSTWETAAATLLRTGQKQVIEFEAPTLNGIRTFEMAIAPELSEQGTIESLLCISRDITERKQAEAVLRQSEEKFRMAIDFTYAWEYWQAPDESFVYVSPSCERITEYTPAEFIQNPHLIHTIIHPDDRTIFDHHVCDAKSETGVIEFRIMTRSGETRWIAHLCQPVFNSEGVYLGRRASNRDISERVRLEAERQRSEEALRQSEATKQAIIQAIPDLLIRMQADGSYIEFISNSKFNIINPEHHRHGTNLRDILPLELAEKRLHYTQQALEFGETQVYEQEIVAQGKQCYEEVRIVPLMSSEVLVMVRDITDHKRAETALQLSEERLQLALEASGDGLWDWDFKTGEVYLSPRYQEMLGYVPNELVMNFDVWQQMIHPDDRHWVLEHLNTYLQGGSVKYSFDYRIQCKSGEWKWIADYGKVVACDKQGNPLRMIGTHKDISDRKQKELALQRAMEAAEAANLAKSIFLANMSHELRTPLNVILGFTQIMAHDTSLTPSQQADLQTIRRSGDHLLSLINDVLDLSKIEAGHYTLEETGFDLISLLHTLRTMMTERATAKHLYLDFDIAPEVPQFVIADEQKLRQILLNLLSNAIKFTNQGSVTVRVSVGEQESRIFPPRTHASAPIFPLRFEVIDTGVGIAVQEQETIFDAFVQAEAGKKSVSGTGLGLTISRKLLDLMHGEISVQSRLGIGSTFTFVVPVRPTSGTAIQLEQHDRIVIGLAPGQPHRRILVVDDQPENRLLLVRLLTDLGLDVREAVNGQDAIRLWQEWHPDLTWMDIRMPGLDGYAATKQIRAMEQDQASIIIALTAQASHSDRTLALAAGCNDYISKPFREETLFLKLKEYLGLEYLYAEPGDRLNYPVTTALNSKVDPSPFDPKIVANLPIEWQEALEDAALCGNDWAIIDLASQLPPECAPFSSQLINMAQQFQFEQILGLIRHDSFS